MRCVRENQHHARDAGVVAVWVAILVALEVVAFGLQGCVGGPLSFKLGECSVAFHTQGVEGHRDLRCPLFDRNEAAIGEPRLNPGIRQGLVGDLDLGVRMEFSSIRKHQKARPKVHEAGHYEATPLI